MMLRVVLFEIYKRYRLRLEPGARVMKNTVVTTKPAEVRIIRLRRKLQGRGRVQVALSDRTEPLAPSFSSQWGEPTEIPEESPYRNLVIAYGSNFGANKELAERFAERSHFYGYTSDVITLNELAQWPTRTKPWLLVVMTSTYTSNPPSNASVFKSWIEHTETGTESWRNCRYLVWGLGNSQWNAFLAFPRYVHARLAELGATPLAEFAFGDVGSPAWPHRHADWNGQVWPVMLKLSGARASRAAAARVSAEKATVAALTDADSNTTMARSRQAEVAPQELHVPTILTNGVGIDTVKAHVTACRELQADVSPRRTRHLEVTLPPGLTYKPGIHLGVCPKNDEERVERLAGRLGAVLDGLFTVPKHMSIHAVPKGVLLQVRNVLTNLIDITGRPTPPLLDLLLEKVTDPAERTRLREIKDVLETSHGPDSALRTAIDAGGYDAVRLLDEFSSCSLNIFEFLRVAQPLRPRYYSTSSSPRVHGDRVAHVTVGREVASVPGMPDRDFRGVGSHYLHRLREGDQLNVFLDPADGFHLQEDVTKPMIFVSAGTGFAPMRAFLWERLAMKHAGVELAEAALFNGIRSSGIDFIYRDEIEQFSREGVLDHVHIATSRQRPGHRTYVQELIRQQGAAIWRLLTAGGYVYVCGSPAVRDAVRAAFVDVVGEQGSLSPEQAEVYLRELDTSARYRPDHWVDSKEIAWTSSP
jgi:cytochrome P450/NADPH-cytochrome P450 reductase